MDLTVFESDCEEMQSTDAGVDDQSHVSPGSERKERDVLLIR